MLLQANTDRGVAGEAERRGLSSNELLVGSRAALAQPGLVPGPAGAGNTGWSAAPLGLDPTGTPPGRRPDRAGAPTVTGPPARRRQRPRRRITPNTNTSTTTMISTHNHVDMAVSLVGAGRFAVTLLPPTRASNSVTARRLPGPGGCQPVSDHASARWGRALRVMSSQPSRNRIDQHHTSGGPGRRQPTPHDHGEPDRQAVWRGRAAFALLGRGDNSSMVMLRRNGRRRAVGAGPMVRAFGETRTCAEDGCTAQLSRYNPARRCAIHQGWDRQQVTRPRRRCP